MRLCDEYSERMGLGKLFLRHTPKFFLFFDSGRKLLSSKWVGSSNSLGKYELIECSLGNVVGISHKTECEWSSYEKALDDWLHSHSGFVFEKDRVFGLVWSFFVSRNDQFLSDNYDPFLVYSTLAPSGLDAARKMSEDVSRLGVHFWRGKFGEILGNYAYWLEDWH